MPPRSRSRSIGSVGALTLTLAVVGLSAAVDARARTRPARSDHAPVRILLLYDMEGASGVLSEATMNPSLADSFALGRGSLIADVNAVVAGLFDGGATQVDVQNTHGAGDDSLVPRDRLDRRAGILKDDRAQNPYVLGPLPRQPGFGTTTRQMPYDAVVTVAMHDKPMSGGFSPHTIGAGISPIMDGKAVTETELVGYAHGVVGLAVIFSSGDDRLRATLAKAMPWVEYAVVKHVTTPTVVEALPAAQVQRDLHDAAVRAVRGLNEPGRMKVMRLTAPFRAGLLPSYPLFLPPGIGNLPGFEKHGDTVTFAANNYPSAYWGMFVLQRIASAFSMQRALMNLANDPATKAVHKTVMDSVFGHWGDFEAGKWKPDP